MNIKGKNLKVLFYILVGYTLLAFAWWGYLLWQKNEESYQAVIEREVMYFEFKKGLNSEAFFQSQEYSEIQNKHRRQQLMILGEGFVLFVLLLLGIWRLKNTLYKEVELARRQKNFLLSVTHELKSPLASVKLGLETLKRIGENNPKNEKIVNGCLQETNRLDALVNNILLTARLDNNAYSPQKEKIRLLSVVKQVSENISNQYKHSHNVQIDIENNIYLETDPHIINSVCVNLLENAHKYGTPDSNIFVNSEIQGNELVLIFRDEGSGVPENEQKKIFEKFYRSGNEETRNTKGTGLGLYIVKSLLDLINATIEVENHEEKGAVFKVTFPEDTWKTG